MNPVLFTIDGTKISLSGVICGWTFLLTLFTLRGIAKRRNLSKPFLLRSAVYLFFSAIFGARLFFILCNFSFYKNNPLQILTLNDGGIYLSGAVPAGILYLYFRAKENKSTSFYELSDIFSCIFPMTLMFGKISCFLNGCCFGTPSTSFFRVVFPLFSPAFHVYNEFVPLHPIQLYSSILNGIIFLITGTLIEIRLFKGLTFAVFLILFGSTELILIKFRGDLNLAVNVLYTHQLIYLLILTSGIITFITRYIKSKNV